MLFRLVGNIGYCSYFVVSKDTPSLDYVQFLSQAKPFSFHMPSDSSDTCHSTIPCYSLTYMLSEIDLKVTNIKIKLLLLTVSNTWIREILTNYKYLYLTVIRNRSPQQESWFFGQRVRKRWQTRRTNFYKIESSFTF